jgi:hypothetical protein
LSFRFPVSGVSIDVVGTVAWVREKRQGIQFTTLSPEAQQSIRKYIAEVEKRVANGASLSSLRVLPLPCRSADFQTLDSEIRLDPLAQHTVELFSKWPPPLTTSRLVQMASPTLMFSAISSRGAVRRILITPDFNPNLVVRHRTSFRSHGLPSAPPRPRCRAECLR